VSTSSTILLVDDDPDVRDALALLLTRSGFDVRTARHGLDGLRKLQEEAPPAVIIVDLNMPVMDGWDFLQQCPPGIPVVVLSGMDDRQRTEAHPDVAAVLQKPVTIEVLVRTLTPLVGRGNADR
jgi:two-component system response regulator MprA